MNSPFKGQISISCRYSCCFKHFSLLLRLFKELVEEMGFIGVGGLGSGLPSLCSSSESCLKVNKFEMFQTIIS